MAENTISDELKAYKDLRNYEQSDEWKKNLEQLDLAINTAEQKIMDSE